MQSFGCAFLPLSQRRDGGYYHSFDLLWWSSQGWPENTCCGTLVPYRVNTRCISTKWHFIIAAAKFHIFHNMTEGGWNKEHKKAKFPCSSVKQSHIPVSDCTSVYIQVEFVMVPQRPWLKYCCSIPEFPTLIGLQYTVLSVMASNRHLTLQLIFLLACRHSGRRVALSRNLRNRSLASLLSV